MIGVSVRDAKGSLKSVGRTERVNGVQNIVFESKLNFTHVPDQDEQYRFALYDLDNDERVTEEEIVGEAWLSSRLLLSGSTIQLPLKKDGRPVLDVAIIVNATGPVTRGSATQKVVVQETTVSVGVAGM